MDHSFLKKSLMLKIVKILGRLNFTSELSKYLTLNFVFFISVKFDCIINLIKYISIENVCIIV